MNLANYAFAAGGGAGCPKAALDKNGDMGIVSYIERRITTRLFLFAMRTNDH